MWRESFLKQNIKCHCFASMTDYLDFFYSLPLGAFQKDLEALSIIELHPSVCGMDKMLKILESPKTSVIICCGEPVSNSMIADLLVKGADDYVDLNINAQVLVAKVKAHLRRFKAVKETGSGEEDKDLISASGEIKLDNGRMTGSLNFSGREKEIRLSKREMAILGLLISNEGKGVCREDILSYAWREKSEKINSQTLDKYVQMLRDKMGPLGKNIKTIYGLGYMYENEDGRKK